MDERLRQDYIHDREITLWRKVIGKSGRIWVYPIIANSGDQIHVSANSAENEPGYRGFRGYGGSTLKFLLEDGEILELHGPWHSNSDALVEDTEIDLRDKHLTYMIIAKERECNDHSQCTFKDVLYQDTQPMVGEFYRGTLLAMKMSKDLGIPLALYSESPGGSSNGIVYPDQIDVHGNRKEKE